MPQMKPNSNVVETAARINRIFPVNAKLKILASDTIGVGPHKQERTSVTLVLRNYA